jgi:hypothetical protein
MGKDLLGNRDFLAGLVFVLIGALAVAIAARDCPMGTAMRMESGYFPTVLGCILAVLNLPLGGNLGEPVAGAAPVAVPLDHHVLLHRQLQRQ